LLTHYNAVWDLLAEMYDRGQLGDLAEMYGFGALAILFELI
jgi:hypothetical protein